MFWSRTKTRKARQKKGGLRVGQFSAKMPLLSRKIRDQNRRDWEKSPDFCCKTTSNNDPKRCCHLGLNLKTALEEAIRGVGFWKSKTPQKGWGVFWEKLQLSNINYLTVLGDIYQVWNLSDISLIINWQMMGPCRFSFVFCWNVVGMWGVQSFSLWTPSNSWIFARPLAMLSVANYLKCLSKVEKLFCFASWIHCDFTPLFGSFCLLLGELKRIHKR